MPGEHGDPMSEDQLREFLRRYGPPEPDAGLHFDRPRFEGELASMPRPRTRSRTALWIGTTAAVAALLVAAAFFRPVSHAPIPPAPASVSSGMPPVLTAPVTVPAHLTSVDFVSPTVGWIAGWNQELVPSTILHTTNGGRTWNSVTVKGFALSQLTFQNTTDGWALATPACSGYCPPDTVLRTTDGGRTWHQSLASGVPASGGSGSGTAGGRIVALQGSGSNDAFALGQTTLMVTADGGTDWTRHFLPSGLTAMALDFTSPMNGYVAAGQTCPQSAPTCPVEVLHTADGGATWSRVFTTAQPSSGSPQFAFVSFPDASHGWLYVGNLATWQGQVFATADGGGTWTLVQKTFNAVRPGVAAFTFASDTTGWVALDQGAGPIGGGLKVTSDGGATWTWIGQIRNWSIADLSVDPTGGVWAVSDLPNGANFLVHSTDEGKTWTQVLPAPAPTADVTFFPGGDGYGLGMPSDPQALLSTVNGGASWEIVGRLPVLNPSGLSFANGKDGYAIGSVRSSAYDVLAIVRTTDGGHTWKSVGSHNITPDVPATQPLLQAFPSGNVLAEIEVFPDAVVLKRTSNGLARAFSLKTPPGSISLFSFPTETDGFYALETTQKSATYGKAQPEIVLSGTTDGGSTWNRLHTWPASDWLMGLDFPTSSHGYVLIAVHPFSTRPTDELYVTNDGGRSFTLVSTLATPVQNLPGANGVQLQFTDAAHGWILSGSSLLHTSDGGRTWHQVP